MVCFSLGVEALQRNSVRRINMALLLPKAFSISPHFRVLVFLVARDDYDLIQP